MNFYAYTYPAHIELISRRKGLWVKFGDTIRAEAIRMNEQGGASEAEAKVEIKTWTNVTTIARDYAVHRVLRKRGCQNPEEFTGKGTEWFKIPVATVEEARDYLNALVDEVGGSGASKKDVKLRKLQKTTLDKAMAIIEGEEEGNVANIVANLCPRFGKTIWALSLFNRIHEKYGNRIMLLPAYWLSVHSSFADEVDQYREFGDIAVISTKSETASEEVEVAFANGQRVILEVSLHRDVDSWKEKHEWLRNIDNNEFFVFSDEADFGSHTENQVEKLQYIFS